MPSVEVCTIVAPVELGEGPHWDEKTQSLLFVDINGCNLHRYFPGSGRHQILHIKDCGSGSTVSFVIPLEDNPNLLIVGLGRSVAIVEWSTGDPDEMSAKAKAVLHTVDDETPTNRLNDGKCDVSGRLWTGTMGRYTPQESYELHKGSFFSLDSKLTLSKWIDKVSISNGLAWSHDDKTFYYTDSLKYSIDAFDYNQSTGHIENRRKALDYKALGIPKEFPDGMCMDTQGHLWSAVFYGKKVICVDPKEGKIIRTIEMPATNMTSVCWGGPNYDILYATSAAVAISEEDPSWKSAGATFAISGLGARGQKPNNFKCDLQLLRSKFTS